MGHEETDATFQLTRRDFAGYSFVGLLSLSALGLAGCSSDSTSAEDTAKTEDTATGENTQATGSQDIRTIIVATGGQSVNQSFINDKGELDGFDIVLLKEIFNRLPEYRVEFQTMDFSAEFSALETNKVDIILGNFRRSEEREAKYLYTTVPYLYYPYRLIVLEEREDITTLEDLKGKKIGLGPGALQTTIVEHWNEANGNEIEIVYNASGATFIEDLHAGRVDATVFGNYLVDVYNETSDAKIKAVGPVLKENDGVASDSNAYFILRQDDVALRDRVDEALQQITDEGLLREYSFEWFGKDYTPKED
ncbi:MAG: transporter substrate-binding domain-containing protein [Coriobacteriales bacterium]|nr:transporter substrate-binding domain-containing protein [Coriobacteriales bacterium]